MRHPRFGLKMWSTNSTLLPEAARLVQDGVFQYIEVAPAPGADPAPFAEVDVPYVVHATSERYGFNISDASRALRNREMLEECQGWADKLAAAHIIVHPGAGDMHAALSFLEGVEDARVLIENMPKVGLDDESLVGHTPEQVQRLMMGRFGLCLDLNHAIKAATSEGQDRGAFLERFLAMRPAIAHVSDGTYSNEKDEHLGIGQGEYDFDELMERVVRHGVPMVTLETARRDLGSFDEDRRNLERLLEHMPER